MWLVWALAAATCVQLAPSPVYVALVIGIASVAVSIHARPGPYARAFPLLLAVGAFFAVVRMVLTVVTTHGVGDVLFTTPHFGLPQLLGGFTVGGTVELQVMLQSLAEGFAIVGVMGVFGAFNSVVSHSELVESTPRAFFELGLVIVVGLAFVPSTLAAIHDVREADRARTGGRVVRRGRLLRQVVPVLELGLERAVTLAESMDSRGFAARARAPRPGRRLVGRSCRAAARRRVRRADRRGRHRRGRARVWSARSASAPPSCWRRPTRAARATGPAGCAGPTGSSPRSAARAGRDGHGVRRRATAAWSGSRARSRGPRSTCCPRSRCSRCSCPRCSRAGVGMSASERPMGDA